MYLKSLYILCSILKNYGLEEASTVLYNELLKKSALPININYDCSETVAIEEELYLRCPNVVLKILDEFFSLIACTSNHNGFVTLESIISIKDKFSNLFRKFCRKLNGYLSVNNAEVFDLPTSNFYKQKIGINNLTSHEDFHLFFENFGKSFYPLLSVYGHQHIEDTEFGTCGESASIYIVKIDKTGNSIITAGDDGIIRLWNTNTGNLILSIRRHMGDITDLDINSNNTLIVSCCGKGYVWLTFVCGNNWIPLAIIENPDRMTFSKFACSRNQTNNDNLSFCNSELLLTAGDNAIVSIYKVIDLIKHGLQHWRYYKSQSNWTKQVISKLISNIKMEDCLLSSSAPLQNSSIFYKASPLYKIDLHPLIPRAFDICLTPMHHYAHFEQHEWCNSIYFSVGAYLLPNYTHKNISIKVTNSESITLTYEIKGINNSNGYALVFCISLSYEESNQTSIYMIQDMPQIHCDHPDVSFANNSNDLITASDDGVVIMWILSSYNILKSLNLKTYISERIENNAYSRRKNSGLANLNVNRNATPDCSLSEDDSDYTNLLNNTDYSNSEVNRRNPFRNSRNTMKQAIQNFENEKTSEQNVAQLIDSIEWVCNDSMVCIAHVAVSKSSLERQRNLNSVYCVECCVSFFSRVLNGRRIVDVVLPATHSRFACLKAHPKLPHIILAITYNGSIFIISQRKICNAMNYAKIFISKNTKNRNRTTSKTSYEEKSSCSEPFTSSPNIVYHYLNIKNPYLNACWFPSGIGFVASQKYGCYTIFYLGNNYQTSTKSIFQSYKYSLYEQFFLSDFSEVHKHDTWGFIDPNLRKPIYLLQRSVIVDAKKRMYPELIQPPIPQASPLGSLFTKEDLKYPNIISRISDRLPMIINLPLVGANSDSVASESNIYVERCKYRISYKKKEKQNIVNQSGNIWSALPQPNRSQSLNLNQHNNVLPILSPSNNSIAAETFSISYESEGNESSRTSQYTNDEDFAPNSGGTTRELSQQYSRRRRIRNVTRSNNRAISTSPSLSSDEYGSGDITSQDSLFDEIRQRTRTRTRYRITRSRRNIEEPTGSDEALGLDLKLDEDNSNTFHCHYYKLELINSYWIPYESTKLNHSADFTCILCTRSTSCILGFDLTDKYSKDFTANIPAPILHGVNGSIDMGSILGPFDYSFAESSIYSKDIKLVDTSSNQLSNNKVQKPFYIHSRCLITLPNLHWEFANKEYIYTNMFDIIYKLYKPDTEPNSVPRLATNSLQFKNNILLTNCDFCHTYGASIKCNNKRCSRRYHYICTSMIYHSFPSLSSVFQSPRESSHYWADICLYNSFYCPKCIISKADEEQKGYSKRDCFANNDDLSICRRAWLLNSCKWSCYVPQINDVIYYFPIGHSALFSDDSFYKQFITNKVSSCIEDNKRSRLILDKNTYLKCKVINISYAFYNVVDPEIQVILTLGLIRQNYSDTELAEDCSWQIRYLPVQGPDYLILEQCVNKSLDIFRTTNMVGSPCWLYVDGSWHEAIVKQIEKNFIWEMVKISWLSTDPMNITEESDEWVNPWELYFKDPLLSIENKDDRRKELLKIFTWIASQGSHCSSFSLVDLFMKPVPIYSMKRQDKASSGYSSDKWVLYYWREIPLPLCIEDIIERIKVSYYRSDLSLIFDVRLLRVNCEHFNQDNNVLTRAIRYIELELLRLILAKRLPRYILQTQIDKIMGEIVNSTESTLLFSQSACNTSNESSYQKSKICAQSTSYIGLFSNKIEEDKYSEANTCKYVIKRRQQKRSPEYFSEESGNSCKSNSNYSDSSQSSRIVTRLSSKKRAFKKRLKR
ncbi:uncharacterized protein CMU_007550 [Cryptosporidium muris RN66]|uniref:Bromo domain-containing protein n=1 Tax=Cryptosporidium muris (strain RN66) TaxID=441375 RepID=B6ADH4_CRYMR|nr:uncharacterized protein CMU_007550 [Cryptosporidium muris RN66]EEA06265.1 hypothetical protein, conserved [Cryptosporidium muris RN66]|eukprot:XP_002140614.1 hypothetical protein [Cryptosporidium muris RN66]